MNEAGGMFPMLRARAQGGYDNTSFMMNPRLKLIAPTSAANINEKPVSLLWFIRFFVISWIFFIELLSSYTTKRPN